MIGSDFPVIKRHLIYFANSRISFFFRNNLKTGNLYLCLVTVYTGYFCIFIDVPCGEWLILGLRYYTVFMNIVLLKYVLNIWTLWCTVYLCLLHLLSWKVFSQSNKAIMNLIINRKKFPPKMGQALCVVLLVLITKKYCMFFGKQEVSGKWTELFVW